MTNDWPIHKLNYQWPARTTYFFKDTMKSFCKYGITGRGGGVRILDECYFTYPILM